MKKCKNCKFIGEDIDFKIYPEEIEEIYGTEGGISVTYHCPKCDSIDLEDLDDKELQPA